MDLQCIGAVMTEMYFSAGLKPNPLVASAISMLLHDVHYTAAELHSMLTVSLSDAPVEVLATSPFRFLFTKDLHRTYELLLRLSPLAPHELVAAIADPATSDSLSSLSFPAFQLLLPTLFKVFSLKEPFPSSSDLTLAVASISSKLGSSLSSKVLLPKVFRLLEGLHDSQTATRQTSEFLKSVLLSDLLPSLYHRTSADKYIPFACAFLTSVLSALPTSSSSSSSSSSSDSHYFSSAPSSPPPSFSAQDGSSQEGSAQDGSAHEGSAGIQEAAVTCLVGLTLQDNLGPALSARYIVPALARLIGSPKFHAHFLLISAARNVPFIPITDMHAAQALTAILPQITEEAIGPMVCDRLFHYQLPDLQKQLLQSDAEESTPSFASSAFASSLIECIFVLHSALPHLSPEMIYYQYLARPPLPLHQLLLLLLGQIISADNLWNPQNLLFLALTEAADLLSSVCCCVRARHVAEIVLPAADTFFGAVHDRYSQVLSGFSIQLATLDNELKGTLAVSEMKACRLSISRQALALPGMEAARDMHGTVVEICGEGAVTEKCGSANMLIKWFAGPSESGGGEEEEEEEEEATAVASASSPNTRDRIAVPFGWIKKRVKNLTLQRESDMRHRQSINSVGEQRQVRLDLNGQEVRGGGGGGGEGVGSKGAPRRDNSGIIVHHSGTSQDSDSRVMEDPLGVGSDIAALIGMTQERGGGSINFVNSSSNSSNSSGGGGCNASNTNGAAASLSLPPSPPPPPPPPPPPSSFHDSMGELVKEDYFLTGKGDRGGMLELQDVVHSESIKGVPSRPSNGLGDGIKSKSSIEVLSTRLRMIDGRSEVDGDDDDDTDSENDSDHDERREERELGEEGAGEGAAEGEREKNGSATASATASKTVTAKRAEAGRNESFGNESDSSQGGAESSPQTPRAYVPVSSALTKTKSFQAGGTGSPSTKGTPSTNLLTHILPGDPRLQPHKQESRRVDRTWILGSNFINDTSAQWEKIGEPWSTHMVLLSSLRPTHTHTQPHTQPPTQPHTQPSPIRALATNASESILCSGGRNGSVLVWNLRSHPPKPVHSFSGHRICKPAGYFKPDTRDLYDSGDLKTGEILQLGLLEQGSRGVVCDGSLHVWDVETNQTVANLKREAVVYGGGGGGGGGEEGGHGGDGGNVNWGGATIFKQSAYCHAMTSNSSNDPIVAFKALPVGAHTSADGFCSSSESLKTGQQLVAVSHNRLMHIDLRDGSGRETGRETTLSLLTMPAAAVLRDHCEACFGYGTVVPKRLCGRHRDITGKLNVASSWAEGGGGGGGGDGVKRGFDHGGGGGGGPSVELSGFACVAVSIDGDWICAGDSAGSVVCFERRAGKVLHKWKAHTDCIVQIYTVDQHQVFTVSKDKSAVLWDLRGADRPQRMSGITDLPMRGPGLGPNSVELRRFARKEAGNSGNNNNFSDVLYAVSGHKCAAAAIPSPGHSDFAVKHRNFRDPTGQTVQKKKLCSRALLLLPLRSLMLLGCEDGFLRACV